MPLCLAGRAGHVTGQWTVRTLPLGDSTVVCFVFITDSETCASVTKALLRSKQKRCFKSLIIFIIQKSGLVVNLFSLKNCLLHGYLRQAALKRRSLIQVFLKVTNVTPPRAPGVWIPRRTLWSCGGQSPGGRGPGERFSAFPLRDYCEIDSLDSDYSVRKRKAHCSSDHVEMQTRQGEICMFLRGAQFVFISLGRVLITCLVLSQGLGKQKHTGQLLSSRNAGAHRGDGTEAVPSSTGHGRWLWQSRGPWNYSCLEHSQTFSQGVQQALRAEDGRRSLEGGELWREGGWGCVVGQGRWAGMGSRRALGAARGSLHLLGTLQGRSLRGLCGHSGQKL